MKNSFLKHSFLIFILTSIYVASYAGDPWDGTVATSFEGGDGTEENPYQIKTAAQFAYFAWFLDIKEDLTAYSNQYFELIDNIDLNNKPWLLVGWSGLQYDPFTGAFDGKNHKIKNLNIVNTSSSAGFQVGLFSHNLGYIKNLIIESGKVETQALQDCGAIVGYNLGIIENCHNYATVKATNFSGSTESGIGGIVGRNLSTATPSGVAIASGVIGDCVNYGNVINESSVPNCYTGGIVGYDDNQTQIGYRVITRCINFGNVSSEISHTGGIIGKSRVPSTIIGLANFGEVSSKAQTSIIGEATKSEIGGIVGRSYENLQHCMNMGNVSKMGTDAVAVTGGIGGQLNGTSSASLNTQYCYNRGRADFGVSPTSGQTITFNKVYYDAAITEKGHGSTNVTGVESKSLYEMKSKAFVDLLNDTQDPKPWIQCLQLNDGYPIMTFMVKAVTFSNSSTGIIVKTNGQTVKDSVWLGSKVEFSLAPHYQWELGGTTPEIMYATGDITFTKKAVPVTYTITVTSSHTANEISVKGFVNDVEESGWGNGKPILGGSTVRLTAESSSEKYVFVAWEGNDQVSPNPQYTFIAKTQRNIVAKFKARYTINIESSEGGTITNDYTGKDLRLVDEGTTINFTITPQTGYQIKKIVLKNISGENNITFSPRGYVLTLSNVSSNSEISVGFEIYTGIFDNTIQQSIVYARNHQIFVETFEPATVIGYNVMGQEIFSSEQGREETASYEVPVQGLYFVKIKQLQHSIVKKVMVQ